MLSSNRTQFIQTLPLQQKIFLCAVLQELKMSGLHETDFSAVSLKNW